MKIILWTVLLWFGVLALAFGLQLWLDDAYLMQEALSEQLNTLLFGLAILFLISTLQFSGRFPRLFETKWYLFHIIICAFVYLIYNAIFVELAFADEQGSMFIQKSSSFGNELVDKILGNGIGLYSVVLLIFTLVYKRSEPAASLAVSNTDSLEKQIKIKLANKTYFLQKEEILFVRSSNNYIDLHTSNGKHVVRQSISNFEKELDPNHFMRIHRSIIIKIDEVMEFISSGNGDYKVKLKNEEVFNVGNKYKPNVMERFGL